MVVLQQGLLGYSGTTDTYITERNRSANLSTQASLMVRNDSTYQGLLGFNVLSIPPSATINQATLRLYVYTRDSAVPMDVQVHGLLRRWVDTQANWDQATIDNPWGVPGANDPLLDRTADPLATRTVLTSSGWYTFEVTTLVRGWVANPQANQGLVLRGSGANSVAYSFASANYPVFSVRPQLVIDCIIPTPTGTPTPTLTPVPTWTPTPTPTRTPGTPTPATSTPTSTPTPTRTPTATASPTPTAAPIPSPTPILTPTPTPPSVYDYISDMERRLDIVREILTRMIDIFKRTTQTGAK